MIDPVVLVAIGALFSVGLLADQIGRKTRIPRVTLLLLCGLVASGFGLIPEGLADLTDTVTVTALTLVSFLLGGSFSAESLREHGAALMIISLSVVVVTLLLVASGLMALGVDPALSIVLASIATATAPAATLDVIKQSGVSNRFTAVVQGIVAVDDAWGLLAFSFCLAIASQWIGSDAAPVASVLHEVGGAILLGAVIGAPAAVLTGRIRDGEPLMVEALALAFLIAGIASWLGISFLIAGMTTGAMIANFARHHRTAFHEIEHVQWPFMIIFFILAGASLELSALTQFGVMGAALVTLRFASRLVGGWIGAILARTPKRERALYGLALMPQAGVAVGMALLAGQIFPHWKDQIMGLTIGATVIFELLGPVLALLAVKRSARS